MASYLEGKTRQSVEILDKVQAALVASWGELEMVRQVPGQTGPLKQGPPNKATRVLVTAPADPISRSSSEPGVKQKRNSDGGPPPAKCKDSDR